jgi:hypothetical protein
MVREDYGKEVYDFCKKACSEGENLEEDDYIRILRQACLEPHREEIRAAGILGTKRMGSSLATSA